MSTETPRMTKVVYFDEESASDLLDITAGGKANVTSEHVKKRANDAHTKTEAKIIARLSWLPFVGVSGGVDAAAGVSRASQSILSKTLSNTILTDYLRDFESDENIRRLNGFEVRAVPESMAWMKMYTPYLSVMRDDKAPIDPTKLDDALARAKGYYELLATRTAAESEACVLRFNLNAFRNNYGLIDLGRMNLVFHAIKVGSTTLANLNLSVEMGTPVTPGAATVDEILDEDKQVQVRATIPGLNVDLDVYDVILAGVQHAD